MQELKFNHV